MQAESRFGLISAFTQVAYDEADDQDAALKKQLMLTVSLMIIPAGVVWGSLYLIWGEYTAAAIPISYCVISLLSYLFLLATRRFDIYRNLQLLIILLHPIMLMLALGGFHSGSAAIVWSIMAPFGALVFHKPQRGTLWLVAYLALLLFSAFIQPLLPWRPDLPDSFVTGMYVMNIGIVSIIAFVLVRNFAQGKDRALKLLDLEREKSEALLLNVLPKEIAPALKEGHAIIAQQFDSASVLFADIVNFTQLSEKMPPDEMVSILNEIFSHFDILVEKYGLEKIRTIGDNYMVASGVPTERHDHAVAIAHLALDMSDFINAFPVRSGHKFNFRIGINSGPMVAGVIGRNKFHYDLWGDVVNTASRMESSGEPGRIQITHETHALINGHFQCVPRGRIVVKGKGEIETWFLERRKDTNATV